MHEGGLEERADQQPGLERDLISDQDIDPDPLGLVPRHIVACRLAVSSY
jgi:hypothetical protein